MQAEEIRILLIDDHTLVRRGLAALLSQDPAVRVLGQAGDAAEGLRMAAELAPDVVLLDNDLPGVRGVDAVRGMLEAAPGAKVLMLTVSDDVDDLTTALRAGASGYLLKSCDSAELLGALRRARAGETVIGAEMAPKVALALAMGGQTAAAAPKPGEGTLSARESQVVAAISRGASNKQIARELEIAEATVKVHVQSILRKLDLDSRVQIAVYAVSHPAAGGAKSNP